MGRILTIFILCLCMTALIGGCASNVQKAEPNEEDVKVYLDGFLQALNEKDEEAAYELMIHENPDAKDSFTENFDPILEVWGDKKDYTFEKTREKDRPAKDKRPATIIYTYRIESMDAVYEAVISVVGTKGINYFLLKRMKSKS